MSYTDDTPLMDRFEDEAKAKLQFMYSMDSIRYMMIEDKYFIRKFDFEELEKHLRHLDSAMNYLHGDWMDSRNIGLTNRLDVKGYEWWSDGWAERLSGPDYLNGDCNGDGFDCNDDGEEKFHDLYVDGPSTNAPYKTFKKIKHRERTYRFSYRTL